VASWLSSHNIPYTISSASGDWLAISLPVALANELLDADFSVFTHSNDEGKIIRTMKYSIPVELKADILHIHPTVS
jgi:tripeptidyl-peptidase-1